MHPAGLSFSRITMLRPILRRAFKAACMPLPGIVGGVTIAEAPADVRTLREVKEAKRIALEAEAKQHPIVAKVFELFPDAKIADVRTPANIAQAAQLEALPEVEDEWDPFESE